jgi:hypothetical protein
MYVSKCHILAIVIVVFACISALIAVTTPWTAATSDLNGGGDEVVFLYLWRRSIARSNGPDDSSSWASVFSGRMEDQYCPDDRSKTNGGAYSRIRAAQAFSIITLAFTVLHLAVCIAYATGRIYHRATYVFSGILVLIFAACAIGAWGFFQNFCAQSFCEIYRSNRGVSSSGTGSLQQGSFFGSDGRVDVGCGGFVGFGFEIVAMGLVVLAMVPLCLRSSPAVDTVVVVSR